MNCGFLGGVLEQNKEFCSEGTKRKELVAKGVDMEFRCKASYVCVRVSNTKMFL